MLFDYLEGKDIKSAEELMRVEEDELLDAPTFEELRHMFFVQEKQRKVRESLSYEDYMRLRENDSDSPSDYLVVGDPKVKSTWHLPVRSGGSPNHNLMGAAYAALTSNHRGHSYQGPNSGGALSQLHSMYRSEKMKWPGDEGSESEE